jgi:hypothetical protein
MGEEKKSTLQVQEKGPHCGPLGPGGQISGERKDP